MENFSLYINGVLRTVCVPPQWTLLRVLRETLGFDGIVITDDLADRREKRMLLRRLRRLPRDTGRHGGERLQGTY